MERALHCLSLDISQTPVPDPLVGSKVNRLGFKPQLSSFSCVMRDRGLTSMNLFPHL